MWRIYRKTIFPRWHVNRQNPVDNKSQNSQCPKVLVLHPTSEKKKYYNQNKDKQHANKHEKMCWDDPHFHFKFFHFPILETAGWVGTAAVLCLNIHSKLTKIKFDHNRHASSCMFSRNVLAMPKFPSVHQTSLLSTSDTPSKSSNVNKEIDKASTDADILADIRNTMSQYAAAVENSLGLRYINKNNDRKAFRSFQRAAKLGSDEAFFNLGLCYELGKGTRINLNRAAFCYKQAALKGHGLASFNLAVYFFKGMGGLPVDTKTAKLLLREAANKGVPEAQVYIGLEYLEEGRWFDAVAIFQHLSEKNISDGHYYLGLCYENGWGVNGNEMIAAELFAKSARQGHQKATLKLANYYEEGKGGCHSDYEFASALYQVLSDIGNKDGEKALSVLKAKQANLSMEKSFLKSKSTTKTTRNPLPISTSVPEFNVNQSLTKPNYSSFLLPSYLNLMTPFLSVKIDVFQPKASFTLGEDELVKKSFLAYSFNPISNVMKVS